MLIIRLTDLEGRQFCLCHRLTMSQCVCTVRKVFQVRSSVCTTLSRRDENFCHVFAPTCAADPSHIYHFFDLHFHQKIDRQSSDYVEYLWRVILLLKFSPLHNKAAMCSAILMLAFSIFSHYVADIVMMAVQAMMKRKSFIQKSSLRNSKNKKYFSIKIKKKMFCDLFNCKLFFYESKTRSSEREDFEGSEKE